MKLATRSAAAAP